MKPINHTYLFIDTETTALISNSAQILDKQPRVIEFCGILTDSKGKEIHSVDCVVNPGMAISKEVTTITGITNEELIGKPTLGAVWNSIHKIMEMCTVVVAHNLYYDFMVMEYESRRLQQKLPWPLIRICTVENTHHLKGHRLSLTALHEHLFGAPFPKAHRARNDVEAMIRCFFELRARKVIA